MNEEELRKEIDSRSDKVCGAKDYGGAKDFRDILAQRVKMMEIYLHKRELCSKKFGKLN